MIGIIAGMGVDSNAFRMCWEKDVAINHLHSEEDEISFVDGCRMS
jgi:hypothetical protein